MARFCVNCGSSLPENSNFCNICGTKQPPLLVPEKRTEPKHRPDDPSYIPLAQERARSQQEKTGVSSKWIIVFALIIVVFFGMMMSLNNNGKSSTQSSSQARFVLSEFSVTPDEVIMGDSFQITVRVSNTGGSQGTYSLKVLVNDVQISSQNIRLSPNKAETIKVQHKTIEYGEYEVEIGGNSETVLAVMKMSAYELRAEYKENEVAADEKYEDKIIYVEGIIKDIGKDVLDTAYITLDDGTIINSVQCMFKKADESIVAGLKKGQEVTVRGECEGEIIFGNILLRGSSILD